MKVVGLTGSIAMGKSTTADLFRRCGVPVHDSDAAVHDLYRNEAVAPIEQHFPDAVSNGQVDRKILSQLVIGDRLKMQLLESLVHPMVELRRRKFLADCRSEGNRIAVVDIPLLFEIGGEAQADIVVVVSASEDVQMQRALARPGMTREKFEAIKSKQLADAVKRARAHFVIGTDYGVPSALQQVQALLRAIL